MRRFLWFFPLGIGLALGELGGCSSSSSPAATDGGAAAEDVVKRHADATNCVKPGYQGNEKRVGAYCDELASCPDGLGGAFLICTANHGAPPSAWFCTAPCTSDADCGSAASCQHDPRGSGCVPLACGGAPADGGKDATPDAPAD